MARPPDLLDGPEIQNRLPFNLERPYRIGRYVDLPMKKAPLGNAE